MAITKQGWAWVINSPRWHYFKQSTSSLCGKWWLPSLDENQLQDDNHESADNCKGCMARRAALEKQEAKAAARAAKAAKVADTAKVMEAVP